MATPTTYKLTAHSDLLYKLKERPTPKDSYPLKAGNSIYVLAEVLGWLRFITPDGKKAGLGNHYTIEAAA